MDTAPARHVVVAFPLDSGAMAALAERLGGGIAVRDVRADGPAADIVLAPPCSPQAIGRLKRMHPTAALVIVELEDLLRGIDLGGPVSRSLAAGADAYYVAPSTEALGAFLAALPLDGAAAAAEVVGEADQPVALAPAPEHPEAAARLVEAIRREPARRSDPAPGP